MGFMGAKIFKMDNPEFYQKGKSYWDNIPATVDGMLGGFGSISSTDIAGSSKFLASVVKELNIDLEYKRALDCGAGIGRITKNFLCKKFDIVDMVESNSEFLDRARDYIGEDEKKVDQLICSGLEDFIPEPKLYNVIWCQWVLGHLQDEDLILFFKRCKEGITENGIFFVKENITHGCCEFDHTDSSLTRTEKAIEECMQLAGLRILKKELQENFPKKLFDVYMYALK